MNRRTFKKRQIEGYVHIAVGNGSFVKTNFRELESIPGRIGQLENAFVAKTDENAHVIQIAYDTKNKKTKFVICTLNMLFGYGPDVPIQNVVYEEGGLSFKIDSPSGPILGYMDHPYFGTMYPIYSEIIPIKGEVPLDKIPSFIKDVCRTDEYDMAVVTKIVDGQAKKGILTRVLRFDDGKKTYVTEKWKIIEDCFHDEIIYRGENTFDLLNYRGEDREKLLYGKFFYSVHYIFSRTGSVEHACPIPLKEFAFPSIFDEALVILGKKAYSSGYEDAYYVCKKGSGTGLYKAHYKYVRSEFDYLREADGPAYIEKMLGYYFDSLNIMFAGVPTNKREKLIEAIETHKATGKGIAFDGKDGAGKYLKVSCKYEDVSEFLILGENVIHLLKDKGNIALLCVEAVPGQNKGVGHNTECRIKRTPAVYKVVKSVSYGGSTFLVGYRKDGKIDVFGPDFSLLASETNYFEYKRNLLISTKILKSCREVTFWTDSLQKLCTIRSTNVEFKISERLNMLFVMGDNRVYVRGLSGMTLFDGLYDALSVKGDYIVFKRKGLYGIYHIEEGIVVPVSNENYTSIDIILDLNKAIVGISDEKGHVKYNVISLPSGMTFIEGCYDKIAYENGVFRCEGSFGIVYFDPEGYRIKDIESSGNDKILRFDEKKTAK